MSKFTIHKLEEIADVQTGPFGSQLHMSDYKKEGTPIITVEHLGENRIIHKNLPLVGSEDKNRLKKYTLKEGDIVFSRVGSVDRCAYVSAKEDDWMFSGRCLRVRTNDKVDSRFLSFYFNQESFKEHIRMIAVGATMPSINTTILSEVEIVLPPLKEQKVIAEILSSIDDKIDLLHSQNKILEQLAETLFRQWFVEEADESWEVGKLGNIAVVQNGYAFSSRDYVPFQEGHLEVLKMGHIAIGGGLRSNPKKDFVPREEKLRRWTLNKNDIIMGMTDMKDNVVILGVPAMIDKSDKYVLNQRVARIYLDSTEKLLNTYLLYIQLSNKEFIASLQSKASSGVQVNLSTEVIRDCDIIIPPIELQKEKGTAITELYLKKENNDNQIQVLSKLRDNLLPKLISGEAGLNN
jgi:type I restriction enzyme S subunit